MVAALSFTNAAPEANAATLTWDAGCFDNLWTCLFFDGIHSATNWNGTSRPANGDSLTFAGSSGLSNDNDYVSLSIANLSFASGAGAFVLGGNTLKVSGTIANNSSRLQTIDTTISVNGNITVNAGTAGISFNDILFPSGAPGRTISGSGAITVRGDITNASLVPQTIGTALNVSGNNTWDVGTGGLRVAGLSLASGSSITFTGVEALTSRGNITSAASTDFSIRVLSTLLVASPQTWATRLEMGALYFDYGTPANALNAAAATISFTRTADTVINNLSGNAQTLAAAVYSSGGYWMGGAGGLTITGPITLLGGSHILSGTIFDQSAYTDFSVGNSDDSSILVYAGSEIRSRTGYIAKQSGQTGVSATIDGGGSKWTNTGPLYLGYAASSGGTLNVSSGGLVSSSGLTVGRLGAGVLNVSTGGVVIANSMDIGSTSSGVGTALVTGSGSQLNISDLLRIGGTPTSTGTLTVENGASASANRIEVYEQGGLTLRSGATLQASRINLLRSTGTFDWTGGTLRLTGNNSLGDFIQSRNLALLPGMTLDMRGTLGIGGASTLALSGGTFLWSRIDLQGGTILAGNLTGLVFPSAGTLTGFGTVLGKVGGGNAQSTITASGPLTLGDLVSVNSYNMPGTLAVGSNQVLLLSNDKAQLGAATSLAANGQLATVNGANLAAGRVLTFTGNASILGNFTNNGTVRGSGGSLTFLNDVNGAGAFSAGNIVFHAGYSPGNSPAAIAYNGADATFDATSVLTMELFGPTPGSQYDQLTGINRLTFNGHLSLVFGNGFAPMAGTSFHLFGFNSFAGSLAGDRIDVTGFDRARLDFSHLAIDGSFSVAAVPEPGTYAMFAAGIGLIGFTVRRRRRLH